MKFEIDVSGDDIFNDDYVICIANNDDIIKGFKFKKELIETLINNWEQKKYGYGHSDNQRAFFKVKLYCVVIYYLFKSTKWQKRVSLTICRDFHGHKNDINNNLKYLLERKLRIEIGSPRHEKLPNFSKAHRYANLMYKDTSNKLSTYVNISLEDIEKFLKKFKFKRYEKF